MKSGSEYALVLVTAPDQETATNLAQASLKAQLVACVNVVPRIESHFWWQGKIESEGESLLLLKTTQANLEALEQVIVKNHPYDTPEFIAVPLTAGNQGYLDWVSSSVAAAS
jgi:periplasmic divalent cation tolerance protein